MLKYDYSLLGVLAVVVQERSFQRAAKKLGISQSAVSQKIKMLEARQGASLLIRGKSKETLPTEIGKLLCAHVQLLHLLEIDLDRQRSDRRVMPRLQISANHDSLATWFPEILAHVRRELNVVLEILPEDENFTAEKLASGEAHAALSSQASPQHGFRSQKLGAMRYVGIASPEFMREFFCDGVTPESLQRAPAIMFDQKNTILRDWAYKGFGVEVSTISHWIPSFAGYLQACLKGVGWGIMPDFHITTEIKSGELVLLDANTHWDVPMFWHHSTVKTEIMSEISAIVKDVSRSKLSRIV